MVKRTVLQDIGGEVRADASYSLPAFMVLTGLGKSAMRSARQKGLKVRRVGRCAFINGQDWLQFLASSDSSEV